MKKLIINLVCICILVVAVAAVEVNINNNKIEECNNSSMRVIDIVSVIDEDIHYFVKDIDTLDIVSVTEEEEEWLYEPVVGIAPSDDSYAICIFINK